MCCAPKAPDPYATANAQTQANSDAIKTSAQYNQINQTGPFGSQTWSGEIGSPDRTLNTSLSPELTKLLQGQTGLSQGLTDLATQRMGTIPREGFTAPNDPNMFLDHRANNPLKTSFDLGGDLQKQIADAGSIQRSVNLSGSPKLPGVDDFSAERSRVEQSQFNRAAKFLDPRYSQGGTDLETRLANQGIVQGSDAYTKAKADFGRERDAAYQDAADAAVLAGGNEQSRMFGLGLAARQQDVGEQFNLGQFANQAQGQQFGQNQASGQFANDATMQDFARNMAASQFYNQAQGQQFQQGMQLMGYNQDEYQRQLGNQIQGRNQDFNELAAFLQGSPVAPSQPQFQQQTQYQQQAAPIADLIMNNYAIKSQNANAGLGGIFNLGGSLGAAQILKSSEEWKTDKRPAESVLDKIKSLRVERWKYKWQPLEEHIGPYAEEFAERFGGEKRHISTIDAIGVLFKGLQEVVERLDRMEAAHV